MSANNNKWESLRRFVLSRIAYFEEQLLDVTHGLSAILGAAFWRQIRHKMDELEREDQGET